jgi:hypothetical protein
MHARTCIQTLTQTLKQAHAPDPKNHACMHARTCIETFTQTFTQEQLPWKLHESSKTSEKEQRYATQEQLPWKLHDSSNASEKE